MNGRSPIAPQNAPRQIPVGFSRRTSNVRHQNALADSERANQIINSPAHLISENLSFWKMCQLVMKALAKLGISATEFLQVKFIFPPPGPSANGYNWDYQHMSFKCQGIHLRFL
jgi:hypothetical protein